MINVIANTCALLSATKKLCLSFHCISFWQPDEQLWIKSISAALSQLFHSNIKACEQKEDY